MVLGGFAGGCGLGVGPGFLEDQADDGGDEDQQGDDQLAGGQAGLDRVVPGLEA